MISVQIFDRRRLPGGRPNHGYSVVTSVATGSHTICTYGINTGPAGSNPELA